MTKENENQNFFNDLNKDMSCKKLFDRAFFTFLPFLEDSENVIEKIFYSDLKMAIDQKHTPKEQNAQLRNNKRVRAVVNFLISEKSFTFDDQKLDQLIEYIENKGFVLSSFNELDAPFIEHMLYALKTLKANPELSKIFKSISKPFMNLASEKLIKLTLCLPTSAQITDTDTKKAVLTSFLTYFRQNIGSCFATAPALIIQREQPFIFFKDIQDLLNKASLKRVFQGKEYAVPISPSFGSASLRKSFYCQHLLNEETQSDLIIEALLSVFPYVSQEGYEIRKTFYNKLLLDAYPNFKPSFFTLEEIIRAILLKHLSIQEEDLFFAKEVNEQLLNETVNLQQGNERKRKNKYELVNQYFEMFNQVKNVYVSFLENPLLKKWEFTLASFAEVKPDFISWNLYHSLGLKNDEKGGIGEKIYIFLQKKLDDIKLQIEEVNANYERSFLEVKALESQSKSIETSAQANFLKAQYTIKAKEMDDYLEKRDFLVYKANQISGLYVKICEFFIEKFPQFFQEVYDADMQVLLKDVFEDSPAGFRLLFKHGRTNPLSWTLIHTSDQFSDALARFFVLVENEMLTKKEMKVFEKELSFLTAELCLHVGTNEFLISSFDRVYLASGLKPIENPLVNTHKIKKTPWVYTSGGSMERLISCLYNQGNMPSKNARWVESEMELLVFYLDTLKEIPHKETQPYLKDSSRSMLAFSPSHAFVFKPGFYPFKEGWQNDQFTYTFARDNFLEPSKKFIESIFIHSGMTEKLNIELKKFVPLEIYKKIEPLISKISHEIRVSDYKNEVCYLLNQSNHLTHYERSLVTDTIIDAMLVQTLPLISKDRCFDLIVKVMKHLKIENIDSVKDFESFFDGISSRFTYITPLEFLDLVKASFIIQHKRVFFDHNVLNVMIKALIELEIKYPHPILFADSNWPNSLFGFIVGPSSLKMELWRFDESGFCGENMAAWKKWLNGTEKKEWGLFSKPYEYGQ
jgi:hypothetical protein